MRKNILLFGIGLSVLFSMTACGKKSSEEPKSVFSNQSEKEEESSGKISILNHDEEDQDDDLVEESKQESEEIESEEIESKEIESEETKEETLEDILSTEENQNAIQEELDSAKTLFTSYYSDITFEADGNDVSYNYYFQEGIVVTDESAIDTDTLEAQAELLKDGMETQYGVRPDTVSFNYYNADGSLALSYTY